MDPLPARQIALTAKALAEQILKGDEPSEEKARALKQLSEAMLNVERLESANVEIGAGEPVDDTRFVTIAARGRQQRFPLNDAGLLVAVACLAALRSES